MLIHGATVFLQAHSQYRGLLVGVAQKLRGNLDARIHLYCSNAQEVAHYRRLDADQTLFASITADNHLYPNVDKPVTSAEAVLDAARDNENWLGVPINTLALTDRHLGRGYALGGFNHPRSRRSETTSYLQMVQGFNAQIGFWRQEFETKRPDLVVNGTRLAARIARKLEIPYRTLVGSRHRNLHQWAHNELFENPSVSAAYERLGNEPATEAELPVPYHSHMTLRDLFLRTTSTTGVVRDIGDRILRHIWWHLRGYEKAKGYYLGEELRYFVRRWRDRKVLTGAATRSLASLENQRFVYYPLHTEPEVALHGLSPEYFYQLAAIAAISRDLPAGVVLAIKETYEAIGRRPADFYAQIREFKNVVMLDMLELGLEVVRACDAVVTITGTGGFEAAVLGKPVITFGRHNQYNFLPHVRLVTDETKLKDHLHQALNGGFESATMRHDGARFLAAVEDVSFDLDGFDLTNAETAGEEIIGRAYRDLLTTLA